MILLASLLFVPVQGPLPGSLEKLADAIAERTAARRAEASACWEEHGEKWLNEGRDDRLSSLVRLAPEIQEPALEALRTVIAGEPDSTAVGRILQVLNGSMNSAGADLLVELLHELPDDAKAPALRVAAGCGGPKAIAMANAWAKDENSALAAEGFRTLLLHGPTEKAQERLEKASSTALEPEDFASILKALAKRPLPEDFELPLRVLHVSAFPVAGGILAILEARPDSRSEDFLMEVFLNPASPMDMRKRSLAAFEKNAEDFRWRTGERQLAEALKKSIKDELADEVAWALHRLGNREGRKFLLAEPQEEAEANPRDWRVQILYARRLVDLDAFGDAYKIYRSEFQRLEKTPEIFRVDHSEWLWAARAAAGARRPKDSGQWLGRARMSPSELQPFKGLPEFALYLNKQPFKRLFGIR